MNFYRRNYIEGLFLSSAVVKNPDYTTELMIKALDILRNQYRFKGYIHAKAIPGADPKLIEKLGFLADRMSVNIEMPSEESLKLLAPDKTKSSILKPMQQIKDNIGARKNELVKYKYSERFLPAGHSTQMIIGATPDTDYKIIKLTEGLYKKYRLKRVFFSAYVPVVEDSNLLPSIDTKPPLLREHRLYQADFLLRLYGFTANELLDENNQNFNNEIDPKCNWALNNIHIFPVEVTKAPYELLLRVPGIGVTGAKRIMIARRASRIDFLGLKKMGIVLKRAQYFITCNGKSCDLLSCNTDMMLQNLMLDKKQALPMGRPHQISMFDHTIGKGELLSV